MHCINLQNLCKLPDAQLKHMKAAPGIAMYLLGSVIALD